MCVCGKDAHIYRSFAGTEEVGEERVRGDNRGSIYIIFRRQGNLNSYRLVNYFSPKLFFVFVGVCGAVCVCASDCASQFFLRRNGKYLPYLILSLMSIQAEKASSSCALCSYINLL